MRTLSPNDFAAKDKSNVIVLDVRDKASYEKSHIETAHHVESPDISQIVKPDDNKEIVVYCYRGFSSKEFAYVLQQQGYDKVYNLEGGFNAWQDYISCN